MNIKKVLTLALSFTIATFVVSSCTQDDNWDTPPLNCENRFGEANTTMSQVVAMAPALGKSYHTIDTNIIFDGYVISSDEQSNFYKTIVFQDAPENPSVGLQISIEQSNVYADFPVGSHIRINAKGLRIANDRGVIKLGADDDQYLIGRIPAALLSRYISGVCKDGGLDVQTIVPTVLPNLSSAKKDNFVNTLVTVPVQFAMEEISPVQKRYVDFIGNIGKDTDRKIEDSEGGKAVLRTAKYAKFGYEPLPKGAGNMTFIVSKYQSKSYYTPTWQMIIRGIDDVKLTKSEDERFDPNAPKGGTNIVYSGSFTESFTDYEVGDKALPKYINALVEGERFWQIKKYQNNKYLQLGAHNAQGNIQTTFAVPIDFTAANSISFNINYGFFNGQPIKVYLSTDYTAEGGIAQATTTEITNEFAFPNGPNSGYGSFQNVGTYNLPTTYTGNGFLIFKYTGSGNGVTTTTQIDDIVVN